MPVSKRCADAHEQGEKEKSTHPEFAAVVMLTLWIRILFAISLSCWIVASSGF